jgi:hypothetical protein
MKQITASALVTLVIGLIIAYFTYSLSKESVDLRYTISQKIPTKYIESSATEAVQQLIVKNNGNISAEKIQIKVNGVIVDYDVLKNSVADIVEEHYSKGYFEAIYPSLPPDAQFSYIFKTAGEGLTKNSIEIIHNKGRATEALSTDTVSTSDKIISAIFWIIITLYLIMLVIQFRSMAIERIDSSSTYASMYEYLNKGKPFYISQERWNSMRIKYIKNKSTVTHFLSREIEELDSYKTLSQDKPNYISADEWEILKEKSISSLIDHLTFILKSSRSYETASKYFKVEKPKNFPSSQWVEFVENANRNFIDLKKAGHRIYVTAEDILQDLNAGMPDGMLTSFWEQYKDYLLKRYYEIIYRGLLSELHPINFLSKFNISALKEDEQKRLADLAYKIELANVDEISSSYEAQLFLDSERPAWMSAKDLNKRESQAMSYIEHDKSIRKYKNLLSAINDVISLVALKEKPDESINDQEWESVKNFEKQISTIALEVLKDKNSLKNDRVEFKSLKDQVVRQLNVINDILNDPNAIDRIEAYDNPFSVGNFINLQAIAKLLKDSQVPA